jgi:hypothetical protein
MSDYFTHLAMRALGRTRPSDAQPMTRAYSAAEPLSLPLPATSAALGATRLPSQAAPGSQDAAPAVPAPTDAAAATSWPVGSVQRSDSFPPESAAESHSQARIQSGVQWKAVDFEVQDAGAAAATSRTLPQQKEQAWESPQTPMASSSSSVELGMQEAAAPSTGAPAPLAANGGTRTASEGSLAGKKAGEVGSEGGLGGKKAGEVGSEGGLGGKKAGEVGSEGSLAGKKRGEVGSEGGLGGKSGAKVTSEVDWGGKSGPEVTSEVELGGKSGGEVTSEVELGGKSGGAVTSEVELGGKSGGAVTSEVELGGKSGARKGSVAAAEALARHPVPSTLAPPLPRPQSSQSPAAAPEIHIRIGRIEVRAATPPAPVMAAAAPTRGSQSPTLSLTDYLQQSRGRR